MKREEFEKKYWVEGLTVDTVVFTVEDSELKVLLTKRSSEPFKGHWSLPGGVLMKSETLSNACSRVLRDKVGIRDVYLEQLFTFDTRGRDPRGDIITVAYFALVPIEDLNLSANNHDTVLLFPVNKLPKLGFDHSIIIEYAKTRLQFKLEYTNIVFSLLPKFFTLSQLQSTYEVILGRKLDKRNFLKKYLSLGFVKPTTKMFVGGRQRPAKLYKFASRKPVNLKKFF